MLQQIAVLLTVFNRKDKTLACLQNLFSVVLPQGYRLSIFLVSDGCTDGTPEAVNDQFPQVHLIHSNGNLFWNRGMHLAWTTATKTKEFDFYLWLNDDTILNEQAIPTLLKTSKALNNQSIVVGSTAAFNNNELITYGGRSKTKGLLTPEKDMIPCDYFNGNIVLISKEAYKKVGIHDPVFHHALGDFDYGLRAAKLGVKSFVSPGVLGKCDVHVSLPTWCNPNKSFNKRWKAFKSPLGHNPEEFFVFEKRHSGIVKAIFHYITNHARVFFPILWCK